MNKESSRSHAIFTITVESSKDDGDGCTHLKMGKLHLVDLAVSHIHLFMHRTIIIIIMIEWLTCWVIIFLGFRKAK